MIIEKLHPLYLQQTLALQQKLLPFSLDPERAAANLPQLMQDENISILIAREEDTVLGTVSGFCCRGLDSTFLVIEDLIVDEHTRGLGLGTRLMAAMDSFGRSRGCQYAILVSSGFRKQAHRFYEKIGYTEDVRGFRKDL